MRSWLRFVLFCGCVLTVVTARVAAAEPASFHNGLSLQGFTGILNIPSAHVTDEGWIYGLYTNQKEESRRQKAHFQENFQLSLGLFNFIELGGRYIEAPRIRDLSANVKLTSAPLTRVLPLVPVIAVGIQDVTGGAALLQTKYLVASEDIWRLRLSAGYGKGPDRMKGGFAGAELKVHDWLYLLGEYDTKDTNVGARAILPQFWKVPVRFTATAKTSLSYHPGNFDIAVGLSFPLDLRMRSETHAVQSEEPIAAARKPAVGAGESSGVVPNPAPALEVVKLLPVPAPVPDSAGKNVDLRQLRDRFVAEGFLNVRVGSRDRTLVVEYENTIFNHNELDALGLVAGHACQASLKGFDTLRIVIKRRNIRTLMVSAPLPYLRGFLEGTQGPDELRGNLVVDLDTRTALDADFLDGVANPDILNTSLMLSPGLTTFIGTEYGDFDYLLSLKPELSASLWKGAVVAARWDIPLSWSSNLEDGKPYRGSRRPAQLERLMLFQAVQPLPALPVMINLGAGMVLHDRYGMLNEALWNPGDGAHRFRVLQGWTENSTTHAKSDLLLGSYRYYYSPLDVSLEGVAGKFWAEDKGFSLELKRFWEDTAVSLYFKDTKGGDDKTWKAVGLQFSFPLTPRRDMKPVAKLQVRGSDEWSYAQETTLKNNNVNSSRGSLNYLAPYPLAINPQPTAALYRSFYNRDRLSAAYILRHLERLREAWLKYRTL